MKLLVLVFLKKNSIEIQVASALNPPHESLFMAEILNEFQNCKKVLQLHRPSTKLSCYIEF